MESRYHVVEFSLGPSRTRYGLHLVNVLRVLPAVATRPVARAPALVQGLINVEGDVIPLFDLWRVFGLPEHELALSDRIVLCQIDHRRLGFLVSDVMTAREVDAEDLQSARDAAPPADGLDGVAVTDEGMILIYDLGDLLTSVGGAPVQTFLEEVS